MIKERFAPSPTGRLHLGHAYSALLGFQEAEKAGGQWLLRIENIDFTRCREEYINGIFEDLKWLGLKWPEPVLLQSTRSDAYQDALSRLQSMGVIYGCQCTRSDLALSAPHGAGAHYPGHCRELGLEGDNLNWRLNAKKALSIVQPRKFHEIGQGRDLWRDMELVDDVVLARRDIGVSYHLAVVVDDSYQEITHVTRGKDMEDQTPIHVLLQALLDFPTPIYRHHKLICDENGVRLAKRTPSHQIESYRLKNMSLENIKKNIF